MEPTIAEIRQTLGDVAYGEEEDELEHVVARLLKAAGQTLAVAEWATAGLIAHWLSLTPEASDVLAGGVTLVENGQLTTLLGAEKHSDAAPDSSDFATAAAEAVRRLTGTDFGLGVAATPAEPDRPDAHVYAALATPEGTRRLRFACASHPAIRRARTAKQALNALRLTLLGALPAERP